MIDILKWFFDLWQVFIILGIILGIVSGLGAFLPIKSNDVDDEEHIRKNEIRKKWCRPIFVLTIIVLITSGITALSFTYVPDITHKTVQEAKAMLNECGLELYLPNGVPYNDETNQYIITTQYTQFGSFVTKGTEISVSLDYSGNSEFFIEVPNVVGESYTNAISILDNRGLLYNTSVVNEEIDSFENAIIINQSIAANSRVANGTTINLELSFVNEDNSAPDYTSKIQNTDEMVKVPNVVNMEEQEAIKALEACGLEPLITWMSGVAENKDTYFIITQSIPAGSTIPKGTVIEIERSNFKLGTPVDVPNVVGMDQDSAIKLLVSKGLQFQVWLTEEVNNQISVDVYYIKNQSISPDSTVTAGTIIELELTTDNLN